RCLPDLDKFGTLRRRACLHHRRQTRAGWDSPRRSAGPGTPARRSAAALLEGPGVQGPVRRGPRDPPSGSGCHRKSRSRPCGQRLLRRAGEVALAPACRGPSLHGTGLSQPQGEGTLRCFRSGEASGGHSGGPILAASTHG
ncbi:unnamed protein product, partial [Symbiodinium necroappetens]